MRRLENKIAVVTGASTGIGSASAQILAKEGAHVLAIDISASVHDTVKVINQGGNKASGYNVDVSDAHAVERLAQSIKEDYNHIDILCNNAGIDNAAGRIHEFPIDVFDRIMNVDLRGTFLMTKFFLPLMMSNGGSIINMASFSGNAADLNRSAYNAAKAGIINFTRSTAIEYGR